MSDLPLSASRLMTPQATCSNCGDLLPLDPLPRSAWSCSCGQCKSLWHGGVPIREADQLPPAGMATAADADGNTSIWFVSWGQPLPRTSWGRLKLRLSAARVRAADAWSVWKGDAEAVPWGDL